MKAKGKNALPLVANYIKIIFLYNLLFKLYLKENRL